MLKPLAMNALVTEPMDYPNYGIQEAARFLHVPHATMQYWTQKSVGLIEPAGREIGALSFRNLIECYVLQGLRTIHGVRLAQIRHAVSYLRTEFESKHPLADYELKTNGTHVYFHRKNEYLNASLSGQLGLGPVLDAYLRRIDRNFATSEWRLYPFLRLRDMTTRRKSLRIISINPEVCFGMPTLHGSRITTSVLASRYLGGEPIASIARGYDRSQTEIKAAVEWQIGSSRAAA